MMRRKNRRFLKPTCDAIYTDLCNSCNLDNISIKCHVIFEWTLKVLWNFIIFMKMQHLLSAIFPIFQNNLRQFNAILNLVENYKSDKCNFSWTPHKISFFTWNTNWRTKPNYQVTIRLIQNPHIHSLSQ